MKMFAIPACLFLNLISSCSTLPPLQLETPLFRIHSESLEDAQEVADDMNLYDPLVQSLLGIDQEYQHELLILQASKTSANSHAGTSASGQMQFSKAAFGDPVESLVPHELVHAHFAQPYLPELPTYIEEGLAYFICDIIFERNADAISVDTPFDYQLLKPSHLRLNGAEFHSLPFLIERTAERLGYEVVSVLGIDEVLRLGRENVETLEYVRLAGIESVDRETRRVERD